MVSAELFHSTVVLLLNPEPFSVSVNAGPPAAADEGEMLLMVRFEVTVKGSGADEVCPVADTPTASVPAVAMRLAGTDAVNCVDETKEVLSVDPFHVTTAPLEKPEPLAVRVNAAPPATAVLGEMLERTSGGAVIVKFAELDTRLP